MIVEDSSTVRQLLEHVIGADPRLQVGASVATAEQALEQLDRVRPDVISMDVRLPGIDGLEATRRIMAARPTPIVIVSGSDADDELRLSMRALRAGALSVVAKPRGVTHADYEAVARHLCTQLAIMSQVAVVRQRLPRPSRDGGGAPPAAAGAVELIGVVASTGGPNALAQLLAGLGGDCAASILVVQHMSPGFMAGFAAWLGEVAPLPVRLAAHGERPAPGTVYVAGADRHLTWRRARLDLEDGAPVSGQKPSGTVLLASLADCQQPCAGVVLTGMGDDGAAGLLAMRQAGHQTFAEDESSAVVFGMPARAVDLGAARQVLPLPQLTARLLELTARPTAPSTPHAAQEAASAAAN